MVAGCKCEGAGGGFSPKAQGKEGLPLSQAPVPQVEAGRQVRKGLPDPSKRCTLEKESNPVTGLETGFSLASLTWHHCWPGEPGPLAGEIPAGTKARRDLLNPLATTLAMGLRPRKEGPEGQGRETL